jgi:hypothetical protein
VASLVARWRYSSVDQELADHERLARRLQKQAPEIIDEWTKLNLFEQMGAKLHLYNHGITLPPDAAIATIGPITIPYLNLFAHKIALGLYFWHFGDFLSNDGALEAFWRTKEDYYVAGLPSELLKLFSNYDFLKQGNWNEREAFEYRYSVNKTEGLFGCFARCRSGLFVIAIAAAKASAVSDLGRNWIRPIDVLSILKNPKYRHRF